MSRHKLSFVLATLLLGVLIAACPAPTDEPIVSCTEPLAPERCISEQLLTQLREKRDLLAKLTKTNSLVDECLPACREYVSLLIGMPRREIDAALAGGGSCELIANVTECHYSFYAFPPTPPRLGGGPELWLTFDSYGICQSARWVQTA